ncbi:hypothetical protein Salat_2795200 [Sesamum alatum]|uniref:Uncharacterized protein n=1 Tax=Sesamum alatum TaxID=300844 RepID=A0AAE2C999_9LAMI|nr:hypothetical protein Salat_2795200 [Sesamum alatum]
MMGLRRHRGDFPWSHHPFGAYDAAPNLCRARDGLLVTRLPRIVTRGSWSYLSTRLRKGRLRIRGGYYPFEEISFESSDLLPYVGASSSFIYGGSSFFHLPLHLVYYHAAGIGISVVLFCLHEASSRCSPRLQRVSPVEPQRFMGGSSTSNWASSSTYGPDFSPLTSRVLPQKIRGKMPRRSRASSSSETVSPAPTMVSSEAMAIISGTSTTMTEESIRKLITQIALPVDYEWVLPLPCESANSPSPGCMTLYSAQLLSGLCFPLPPLLLQVFNLLGIPRSQLLPNSYRLVVGFLLCSQLYGFDPSVENFLGALAPKLTTRECFIYLTPRPGLTFIRDKPSSHGAWKSRFFFIKKPKWGVHVAWSWFLNALPPLNLGEIKRRMKEAGLVDHEFKAKSILDEELLIVVGLHPAPDTYEGPLDHFTRLQIMMNRAAVRIPEDVPVMPSSSGTRYVPSTPTDLPPELTPSSSTPPSAPINPEADVRATPIIEVITSPEDTTPPPVQSEGLPLEPYPLSPVDGLPSSYKRPRTLEKAAAFNMLKTVNRVDVEVLAACNYPNLGNFVLAQATIV